MRVLETYLSTNLRDKQDKYSPESQRSRYGFFQRRKNRDPTLLDDQMSVAYTKRRIPQLIETCQN
jgi:hypothetical protein